MAIPGMFVIGVDARGGDAGREGRTNSNIVLGSVKALQEHPNLVVDLYGDSGQIGEITQGKVDRLRIVDCPHPTKQLFRILDNLQEGGLNAFVTARNSEELLGASKRYRPKDMPRLGIIATCPTHNKSGYSHIIDVGITTEESDPSVYLGWMKYGVHYLRRHKGIADPWVGLASHAAENGIKRLQNVHSALQDFPEYKGWAEPSDFFNRIDLWLAEGRTANIVLKSFEELATIILLRVKNKMVYDEGSAQAFRELCREDFNPDEHVICPVLGFGEQERGLWVFRLHGRANAEEFARGLIFATQKWPIQRPMYTDVTPSI